MVARRHLPLLAPPRKGSRDYLGGCGLFRGRWILGTQDAQEFSPELAVPAKLRDSPLAVRLLAMANARELSRNHLT